MLLDLIKNSHDIEIIGDDEVAGRHAFHLKATQKDKTSLLGDQEVWIDKANWVVLKMITISGDARATSEYKKINVNDDVSENLFTLDLPDNVTINTLEDFTEEPMIM